MKWYDIKKYQPSYDGWYIVRSLDEGNFVCISYVLWNTKVWLDYDSDSNLFENKITHFAIPNPVEIE